MVDIVLILDKNKILKMCISFNMHLFTTQFVHSQSLEYTIIPELYIKFASISTVRGKHANKCNSTRNQFTSTWDRQKKTEFSRASYLEQ